MTHVIPGSYVIPRVGDTDPIGYRTYAESRCYHRMGSYICTLPRKHWCRFHVAHGDDGEVIATKRMRVPKHLRLPEGL